MSFATVARNPAAIETPAVAAPQPARFDIYAGIHRALRLFMSDTLTRVGALDPADAAEVAATLGQAAALLAMCRAHVEHENRFVHTAIEARAPGASGRVADEHAAHLEHIAALEAEAASLRAAPAPAAATRFYRHLALFVAQNFEHMHVEETAHNQVLWEMYTDDEIVDVEHAIVSSLPPDEVALVLRWMAPALPPAERAAWLRGMQQAMPPDAFRAVLQGVRQTIDARAWDKLARALGVAADA
jgi:hypothetical protein